MLVKVEMCYTHLLEMMQNKTFIESISSVKFSQPDMNGEGFNGFIITNVEFEIYNIEKFAEAFIHVRPSSEKYHEYRTKLL